MDWDRDRPLNSGHSLRKLGLAFSILAFIATLLILGAVAL